ncbi:MAG: hypothetical protein D6690_08005 [Nitrospirae bacterium]|nr:MAG: hypothetical protein D6690_08005 [Nitrospirota bacterium]
MIQYQARWLGAALLFFCMAVGLHSVTAAQTPPDSMVRIPAGEFTMGSNEHEDETPHQVVLDAYDIDTYEVSNSEYRAFLKATGHPAPAYWDDPRLNGDNQPVVGVNWYDAKAFCEWKGKRLPTEAEWEHAAKGPAGHHYPWGHEIDPSKANYGQHVGRTAPVNAYPEGVSGFGVYNMAGNVFEWVADWYDPNYYKVSPAWNPQGPPIGINFAGQGPVKVLRGGSWLAPKTSLHTSHRFWNQPENNSYGVGLGFRCAKSVKADRADQGKAHFILALIHMGKEHWQDALQAIDRALSVDPDNGEYRETKHIILQNLK